MKSQRPVWSLRELGGPLPVLHQVRWSGLRHHLAVRLQGTNRRLLRQSSECIRRTVQPQIELRVDFNLKSGYCDKIIFVCLKRFVVFLPVALKARISAEGIKDTVVVLVHFKVSFSFFFSTKMFR